MNEDDAQRSLASSLAGDPGRTVYGPAVLGTMRVDDPADVAALQRLRAPAMPRAAPSPYPPMPVPPPPAVAGTIAPRRPPMPELVALGAALAIVAAPVGLVVSTIALRRIVRADPRPAGELLALLSIAASVLTMLVLLVLVVS